MGTSTSAPAFAVYFGDIFSSIARCKGVRVHLDAPGVSRDLTLSDLQDGWFIWTRGDDAITFTVSINGKASPPSTLSTNRVGVWEFVLNGQCLNPQFNEVGTYPGSGTCDDKTFMVYFPNGLPSSGVQMNASGFGGQLVPSDMGMGGRVLKWCQHVDNITLTVNGTTNVLHPGGWEYKPDAEHGIVFVAMHSTSAVTSTQTINDETSVGWEWLWWLLVIILVVVALVYIWLLNKTPVTNSVDVVYLPQTI